MMENRQWNGLQKSLSSFSVIDENFWKYYIDIMTIYSVNYVYISLCLAHQETYRLLLY